MITIHYDFTDGSEVSFHEGLILRDNFTTCCLDFFNFDIETDDVIIIRKDGKRLSRKNINEHCEKEIRKQHNIHKMFVAGSFDWL